MTNVFTQFHSCFDVASILPCFLATNGLCGDKKCFHAFQPGKIITKHGFTISGVLSLPLSCDAPQKAPLFHLFWANEAERSVIRDAGQIVTREEIFTLNILSFSPIVFGDQLQIEF